MTMTMPMQCTVKRDELSDWRSREAAFDVAFRNFASQLARQCEETADETDMDVDAARKALDHAAMEVARTISTKPAVVQAKEEMISRLTHLSAYYNEVQLEDMAAIIGASNRQLVLPARPSLGDAEGGPLVEAKWPPAQEFWAAHRALDQACIDPERGFDSDADQRLGVAAALVLRGSPTTPEELADKIRIAAFVGILQLVCENMSADPRQSRGPEMILEGWQIRLMKLPADVLLAAWLATISDACSSDELIARGAESIADGIHSDELLVRIIVGASGARWRRSVWLDAQRLGFGHLRS